MAVVVYCVWTGQYSMCDVWWGCAVKASLETIRKAKASVEGYTGALTYEVS